MTSQRQKQYLDLIGIDQYTLKDVTSAQVSTVILDEPIINVPIIDETRTISQPVVVKKNTDVVKQATDVVKVNPDIANESISETTKETTKEIETKAAKPVDTFDISQLNLDKRFVSDISLAIAQLGLPSYTIEQICSENKALFAQPITADQSTTKRKIWDAICSR